ncbi:MAG: protein kinase [Deltaproteobacteria bacterium]|nr:protein kinase [Deltaproteobacteria bacterium]MBW2534563.1 protein kinase [Deltaproteobacteria bacterium]
MGTRAPSFDLVCFDGVAGAQRRVGLAEYRGSWLVLLFCPLEMLLGCGAELGALSDTVDDFRRRGCEILAVGPGPEGWYPQPAARDAGQEWVAQLRFPVATDPAGTAARAYGVANEPTPGPQRGLFIIDPAAALQYQAVHDVCIGRSTEEMLRIVDALRAGGMCTLHSAAQRRNDGAFLPLGPDQVLGHYRVERMLGEGGFGQVFCGWDTRLHRRVALKLMRPGSKAGRQRILAEARLAAGLNHPNICTIYSVDEHVGLPVIAMEYLAGVSLSQHLRRWGPLGTRDTRAIIVQVARGIAAAHRSEIVHGDLKPGNIMLTGGGVVKVLDFGLAAHEDEAPAERPRRTSEGKRTIHFRGTPPYMSPEQAQGGPALPASDVYTLGLVICEMLTGARAVPARTVRSAVRYVRNVDPLEMSAPLPTPFRQLVADCLSPSPRQRPTMADIAERVSD